MDAAGLSAKTQSCCALQGRIAVAAVDGHAGRIRGAASLSPSEEFLQHGAVEEPLSRERFRPLLAQGKSQVRDKRPSIAATAAPLSPRSQPHPKFVAVSWN